MSNIVYVFDFILSLVNGLFQFLNKIYFEFEGFTIYYGWLIIGLLIIYMACSVFWKGARV